MFVKCRISTLLIKPFAISELWKIEQEIEEEERMRLTGDEYLGSNMIIRPSDRFKDQKFTGSFISKAFRTYGEYNPGKKKGKALVEGIGYGS